MHPRDAHSILISGGTVIDGTGAPGRRADLRIRGSEIVEIGRLRPQPGERVIEAHGMVVAPGFIDAHSHADTGLKEHPEAEQIIRQGITTAIIGQDGGSHLPLSPWLSEMHALHVALNLASFVGHGTVRKNVMGADFKRAATPEEIGRMRTLVRHEMDAGALGLSTGLEYDPGFYSTTAEVIALAKEARRGIYISHMRNEDNTVFKSIRELIAIAKGAHIPAQVSHIKLGSASVWHKAPEALRMMAEARRGGLDITADLYPYLYWSSTITVIIPTRNWADRAAWQKGLADIGGPEHVLLTTYTPDAAWQGKTIAQIAQSTGKDPISVIQEVIRKTHGDGKQDDDDDKKKEKEGVVVTAMSEDDLRAFMRDPHVMFCTDGVPGGGHPRAAGSFPRILGLYVREQHVLPLDEAIRKMTSLPAARFGIADRGLLKPGMKADIVVFNPATVIDSATTSNPGAAPEGIDYVIVNGQPVIDHGRLTTARPGEPILRHSAGRT